MITNDEAVFPNNVVAILKTRTQLLDSDLFLCSRPLRSSDPVQSVGIFPAFWNPDEQSYETIGASAPGEPTLQTYQISIQALVKDMDEERGLAVHSVLSAMIRSMLYRDALLRVGLGALSVTMDGNTERAQRWGIRTQRFLSNELEGSWIYLSTLDFWLETETV